MLFDIKWCAIGCVCGWSIQPKAKCISEIEGVHCIQWTLALSWQMLTIPYFAYLSPRLQVKWMRTCLWQSPAPTQPRSWTCTLARVGSLLDLMLTWSSGTRTSFAPSLPRHTTQYVLHVLGRVHTCICFKFVFRSRLILIFHSFSRFKQDASLWTCERILFYTLRHTWPELMSAVVCSSRSQWGNLFSWVLSMVLIVR